MTWPRLPHPSLAPACSAPPPAWRAGSWEVQERAACRGSKNDKGKRGQGQHEGQCFWQGTQALVASCTQVFNTYHRGSQGVCPPSSSTPKACHFPSLPSTHPVLSEETQRLLSARPVNPNCDGGAFNAVIFRAEILTATNNQ